jgi:two-component system OmpR family response regulator
MRCTKTLCCSHVIRAIRVVTSRVAMPDASLALAPDLAVDLATRILIVDDDPGIRELTAAFLVGHGYAVDVAADGTEMRARLEQESYALIVLDVMMPGEDGLSILRSLDRSSSPAVIIMSVISEEVDRIVGLEMGADDYVAKPANPRELLARIRSVLRRNQAAASAAPSAGRPYLRFAGWRLDPVGRQLFDPDQVVINLSDGEFRLLLAFAEHPRRVLTRDQLLDLSRGLNAEHFDRAIDVQVSRLRRKLTRDDAPGGDELIRTVRNEGYMFTSDVERR